MMIQVCNWYLSTITYWTNTNYATKEWLVSKLIETLKQCATDAKYKTNDVTTDR